MNKKIVEVFEKWQEIDKMVNVVLDSGAWDNLMKVVEFIEDIDTGNVNFNGYTVEIVGHCCFIDVQLELDPSKSICRKIGSNKFEAVLDACYQFSLMYNKKEL
jgi:hypothetical protein